MHSTMTAVTDNCVQVVRLLHINCFIKHSMACNKACEKFGQMTFDIVNVQGLIGI